MPMTATKTPILLTQLPPMRASHSSLVRRAEAGADWKGGRKAPGNGRACAGGGGGGAGERVGGGPGAVRGAGSGGGAGMGDWDGMGGGATWAAKARRSAAASALSSPNRRFSRSEEHTSELQSLRHL